MLGLERRSRKFVSRKVRVILNKLLNILELPLVAILKSFLNSRFLNLFKIINESVTASKCPKSS